MIEITYLEGIRQGLRRAMQDDPRVLMFGEDVAAFGGAFKVTAGLLDEFGPARVFDTPVAESAIFGAALGMASQGLRPVVEMQFADFATVALHQIMNNAATFHYRTGCPAPLVIRMPCGGGFGGGPFHSEELEAFFCHMPGLKVVYPAFPSDARGLLLAAVRDNNPVIYLENKYLYRHVKELVPRQFDAQPLGRARICRHGQDAVVLTYGAMVHDAMRAAERVSGETGHETMVVDLRTLKPYDTDTILSAVASTNRVLIVHEGWRTGGFGAELAALVAEHAFHLLDAPVRRLTAPDCPVPFAPELEQVFRPSAERIESALVDLIEY